MQASFLIGKCAHDQGENLGTITDICWQKGKQCALQTEKGCFVGQKIAVKDSVLLQNATKTNFLPTLKEKTIYDNLGKFVGKVEDCDVTATLKLKIITTNNGESFGVGKILQNNDVVIVRNPEQIAKRKLRQKLVSSADTQSQEQPTTELPACEVVAPHSPKRNYGDFSFLVGKRVDKTIVNFNGEVMIKQGEFVTRQVYLQAKIFGKLTELCLHVE